MYDFAFEKDWVIEKNSSLEGELIIVSNSENDEVFMYNNRSINVPKLSDFVNCDDEINHRDLVKSKDRLNNKMHLVSKHHLHFISSLSLPKYSLFISLLKTVQSKTHALFLK